MRRVYLSGPITLGGTASPEQVTAYKAAFNMACGAARSAGIEPLNPCDLTADDGNGDTWEAWMRRALGMLLLADEVWLLPDWHLSPGARIEASVASWLMPVREFSAVVAEML